MTLVEMLLVVCLIAVIAGLVWPSLNDPLANQQLRKAAEQVRTQWTKARLAAVSSGRIHTFRFQPGSAKYRIAPHSFDPQGAAAATGATTTSTTAASTNSSATPDANDATLTVEDSLPDGISFVGDDSAGDTSADTSLLAATDTTDTTDGGWSAPILFYPDGTAADGSATLKNAPGRTIKVSLRGLTGVATLGDVVSGESKP